MRRRLWKAQSSTFSQQARPQLQAVRHLPEPIRQPSLVAQTPAAAPKKKSRRKDGRVLATIPDLEAAITEAVRSAAPECETFAGVVLQQTKRDRAAMQIGSFGE